MLSVKEINLLEAQNEGLKKQNADLQKENTRLKGELDAYQMSENEANEIIAELEAAKNKYYQQTLDDEIQINELYQTLREIKGAVTALYMNNWLQMNETARKSIQLLQGLITKSESEVE